MVIVARRVDGLYFLARILDNYGSWRGGSGCGGGNDTTARWLGVVVSGVGFFAEEWKNLVLIKEIYFICFRV